MANAAFRAALVVVAVVSAGVMAYVVAVPWGVLLAIMWLVVACWATTDWSSDDPDPPTAALEKPDRVKHVDGLRIWFFISLVIAAVAALVVIVLLVAMLHWDWLAQRVGGVLTPAGAVVVAAIASAGAARTLLAQRDAAQRERFEDAERLLWDRFAKGAAHLADSNPFVMRASAVYALAALADDWIRHNKRRKDFYTGDQQPNAATAECETIVDILCAHLRRNTHLDESLTVASHARPPDWLWAGTEIRMDLRGADLNKVLWQGVDFRKAIFRKANLFDADLSSANLAGADLRDTDLRGAWLKEANVTPETEFEGAIYDEHTAWPTEDFPIPPDAVQAIDQSC